jgi:hypothetical protein
MRYAVPSAEGINLFQFCCGSLFIFKKNNLRNESYIRQRRISDEDTDHGTAAERQEHARKKNGRADRIRGDQYGQIQEGMGIP